MSFARPRKAPPLLIIWAAAMMVLSSPPPLRMAQVLASQSITSTTERRMTLSASDTKENRPNILRRLGSWFKRLFHRDRIACGGAPPTVSVSSSSPTLTIECAGGAKDENCPLSQDRQIQLTADSQDPEGTRLLYSWAVTAGTIIGEGNNVSWELKDVTVRTYTATVTVSDGSFHTLSSSTTVTVTNCPNCKAPKEKP
jgi:hypothetical protein